jgi:hypothetical protein
MYSHRQRDCHGLGSSYCHYQPFEVASLTDFCSIVPCRQITQPFELWLTLSPHLPKTAVVSAANAVAKWIKREESKLFIRDAPVF